MMSANRRWKIEIFGGLCMRQEDRVLHRFRAQKPGALLAYLAYYPRRPHPREVLVELLWPNGEAQAGRNSLNTALSSLRRQLEPPGIPTGTVLQADRFTVQLNPAAFTTDVAEFQDALRAIGRTSSRQEQIQHLIRAVDLYQGELLAGYYEDWIFPEQRRLADLYFDAVLRLTTHLTQEQDLPRAIDYARQALRRDMLNEEIHHRLMHLYTANHAEVKQANIVSKSCKLCDKQDISEDAPVCPNCGASMEPNFPMMVIGCAGCTGFVMIAGGAFVSCAAKIATDHQGVENANVVIWIGLVVLVLTIGAFLFRLLRR